MEHQKSSPDKNQYSDGILLREFQILNYVSLVIIKLYEAILNEIISLK